jgi:hypothetical protein
LRIRRARALVELGDLLEGLPQELSLRPSREQLSPGRRPR